MDLHDARHSSYARHTPLGNLMLAPWYTFEQARCALLHHAFETAPHIVRRAKEVELGECVAMPYIRVKKENRRYAYKAYSLAYVCGANEPGAPRRSRSMAIVQEVGGYVWFAITPSSLCTVMRELALGLGRVVLRIFWHWPVLAAASAGSEEGACETLTSAGRPCETITAAGSPVFRVVSPVAVPGSPGSVGSGDGSGEEVAVLDLRESAVGCVCCDRMVMG